MIRPTSNGDAAGPVRRKSTLYCPQCGHANAIDGDWIRHARGSTVEYACPACAATVVQRPRTSEDEAGAPRTALGRVVRRSFDVWRASVDGGLRAAAGSIGRNRPGQ